jgi:hypothetical protein
LETLHGPPTIDPIGVVGARFAFVNILRQFFDEVLILVTWATHIAAKEVLFVFAVEVVCVH